MTAYDAATQALAERHRAGRHQGKPITGCPECDGQRIIMTVILTPAEAIRVARGFTLKCITLGGEEVEVRMPTLEEAQRRMHEARARLKAEGMDLPEVGAGDTLRALDAATTPLALS